MVYVSHQNQQERFETMLVDLQGQIERITYTNDENGYTIAKVKVYDRRDLVTVVGNFMAPMPGEILKMQGEWAGHPEYGEQFKVVHYKSLVPASVVVVIPILTQHYVLLQRNLIYTAVTRGKKSVVLVGSRKALAIGIGNDKARERNTYLRNRLSL
jgi:ATP-dependent exoDNAse (exonuclease V) alpha subunit